MPSLLWLRRDLRLTDHPALSAAVEEAQTGDGDVVALFVADPRLWSLDAAPRLTYLARSLAALDADLDGRLVVRCGAPQVVVPEVAREIGAARVHVTAATEPYGRSRDASVARALGAVRLVATGSPYAVAPGRLRSGAGTPYQVFTPFRAAWLAHGWPDPAPAPAQPHWVTLPRERLPQRPDSAARLPPAGERAARDRWGRFLVDDLPRYHRERDRPDLDTTSRLSAALKLGELHPRTLLTDLAGVGGDGDEDAAGTFRSELAWREFHADVLWHHPTSAGRSLRQVVPDDSWATGPVADQQFAAWAAGRTGYPFVDAGLRQLLVEGWMHNRVRMVVASFAIKDLHLPWQRGAAHFMAHLVDGDVASNQLSWQWVAGTGRDAAPFHRIFNPVTQGRRFDPDGDYVRRWVPELRTVPGADVHEPWRLPGGPPAGYPGPIVDHAAERRVALAARHTTDR